MRCNPALLLLITALLTPSGRAQEPSADQKLIVGTKPAPPFAIPGPEGEWTGISVDLWKQIADRLDLEYELRETDLMGLLEGLETGKLDASVAALTITSEREARVDFTHPFHRSGLGIAISTRSRGEILPLLRSLISVDLVKVLGIILGLLLGVGAAVWLFERRANADQFPSRPVRGLGSGFWWSAVTLTTVGYGDKAPVSVPGRLLAVLWMFGSVLLISAFTAAVASALTVMQLDSAVQGPDDLPGVRVATVADSTSEAALRNRGVPFQTWPTAEDGLQALTRDEVDAVVYDAPLLRYLAATRMQGEIRVLPVTFEPQMYAIALPQGSPLREAINRELLQIMGTPEWEALLLRYLGEH